MKHINVVQLVNICHSYTGTTVRREGGREGGDKKKRRKKKEQLYILYMTDWYSAGQRYTIILLSSFHPHSFWFCFPCRDLLRYSSTTCGVLRISLIPFLLVNMLCHLQVNQFLCHVCLTMKMHLFLSSL